MDQPAFARFSGSRPESSINAIADKAHKGNLRGNDWSKPFCGHRQGRPQPDMAISVRSLKKHFGLVRAVDGLDLDVPRGSSFGFIGPNGAGKTTFIKLLLSICRPMEGQLCILGGHPEDPAVRRRIGYLPERIQLPAAFNAIAFLRSVGRLKGLSRTTVEQDIPRVLEMVDLQPEAHSRAIGKFSKGMRQRTALAGALLGDPELLILDEPTDGIDPIGRAKIRAVIDAYHRRGSTVFLNSHLLAETEKMCDHVALSLIHI